MQKAIALLLGVGLIAGCGGTSTSPNCENDDEFMVNGTCKNVDDMTYEEMRDEMIEIIGEDTDPEQLQREIEEIIGEPLD